MPDKANLRQPGSIDEAVIWRFETAWTMGTPLPIEEVLPASSEPSYLPTLEELILIEKEWMRKRIQRDKRHIAVTDEEYLRRFPDLEKTEIIKRLSAEDKRVSNDLTPLRSSENAPLPGPLDTRTVQRDPSAPRETLPTGPPGYQIFGLLGRGGMGVVYRARQTSLNRVVALKVMLRGTLAGEDERQRFHTEAATVAALRHPQVVQLYEYGTWQGQPYIALEFVEGGTLSERVARGPLPFREAAKIVELMARAIAAAHDGGIIHRDLKPSNVLLDAQGRPKISDFGLAKQSDVTQLQGSSELTQTGMILGTPSYMAPEQARGEKQIGPAADIYALGAILYQLLTGKPPFLAATAVETLQQVQSMEPVSPRRLVPGLPRDLDTICLKCLQKELPRRYLSARVLGDDLRAFLDHRPIAARPVGQMERSLKWVKRQPVTAALSLLLVLSLIVGVAGIFWQWRSAVANFTLAEQRAENERQASEARAQALQEMQGSLYLHRIARADRAWWDYQIATADQLLDDCPEELRDWEWRLIKQRCHSELLLIDVASPCVAFHPNGTSIAIAAANQVQICDASTGAARQTFLLDEKPTRLTFSPTGDRLAIAIKGKSVAVWDVAAGREIRRLADHPGQVLSLSFNQTGDRLACGTGVPSTEEKPSGEIWIWDLGLPEPALKLTGHKYPVGMIAYSRDGRRIATAAWDHNVIMWDANEGKIIQRLHEGVFAIDMSADGDYLAAATVENSIRIWDLKAKQIVADLPGHSKRITRLAFSIDGSRLASSGMDGTARVWDWRNRSVLAVLRGHSRPIEDLSWSQDGERLATTGESVRVWSATTPQEGRLLARCTEAFALSPDSQRAATAAHGNHTISLWNLSTGESILTVVGHTDKVTGLCFARNGAVLISASLDSTVKLWDTRDGRLLHTLKHDRPISALAIESKGNMLAAGCDDGAVVIWDSSTANQIRASRPVTSRIVSLAFRPDAPELAIASSDREIVVQDIATDTAIRKWAGYHLPVTCLAFTPSGNQLIATSGIWDRTQADGAIRMWDIATGEAVGWPQTPNSPFFGIVASPGGQRIATAGQSIQLWETTKGVEVVRLELPDRVSESYFHVKCGFAQVHFSADGVWLGARALDGSVWLWGRPPVPRSIGRVEAISWETEVPKPEADTHRLTLKPESFASRGIQVAENSGILSVVRARIGTGHLDADEQILAVLPIGHSGWFVISDQKHSTSYRYTLKFDRALRGAALTRIGSKTGSSLPIWRMEALDAKGNVVATTGEIDWSMDGQSRTFGVRANGIAAIRIITHNTSSRNEPFATWSHLPITRLELER